MTAIDVARSLPFWKGKVEPKPVKGGITNANFLVEDAGQRYFVRVGEDIPIHGVMRFNESAASRAAAACGLSPELLHQAPGALVFRFIEAKTLSAEDVRPRAHAGAHPAAAAHLPSRDAEARARAGADLLGIPRRARLRPHAEGRQQPRTCRTSPP